MACKTYKPRSHNAAQIWAAICVPLIGLSLLTHPSVAADPTTQPTSVARPATGPSSSIGYWFEELANADGSRRNQAMEYLMGLRAEDLPALRKLVQESRPLAPEQAMALRGIVTQVFLAGEPYKKQYDLGFLGIHLIPAEIANTFDGALVVDRIPGFIGARMLRDGDVILGIFDRPNPVIRSSNELIIALGDMPAGAPIQLQVLRMGQVVRVALKLDAGPLPRIPSYIDALDHERRRQAEDYWDKQFADLVGEPAA